MRRPSRFNMLGVRSNSGARGTGLEVVEFSDQADLDGMPGEPKQETQGTKMGRFWA
jgi:hypothetical protein